MKTRLMAIRAGDLASKQRCFVAADHLADEDIDAARFRAGEVLECDLRRSRNPGYHRLVHALGKLVARDVDRFSGWGAHDVIKRFQMETGVGCTEIDLEIEGVETKAKVPKSIAFGAMNQDEFQRLARAMAVRLVEYYGHGTDVDEVLAVAGKILEGYA
jgi:hypothetical protein